MLPLKLLGSEPFLFPALLAISWILIMSRKAGAQTTLGKEKSPEKASCRLAAKRETSCMPKCEVGTLWRFPQYLWPLTCQQCCLVASYSIQISKTLHYSLFLCGDSIPRTQISYILKSDTFTTLSQVVNAAVYINKTNQEVTNDETLRWESSTWL